MKTQFTYNFVSKFKLANIISIILVLVSLVLIGLKGLNFGIDFIFHAAALTQVPSCEFYPMEAVKTNIIGHLNIIESVTEVGNTETLMFVSTDKACNPINVYGMCKSISEKLYI